MLVDDSSFAGRHEPNRKHGSRRRGSKVYLASSAPQCDTQTCTASTCRLAKSCREPTNGRGSVRSLSRGRVDLPDRGGFVTSRKTMNQNISRFDASCFDGDYITGDIDEEYLEDFWPIEV